MLPDIERFIRETWVTERALMQQHLSREVQRSLETAAASGQSHGTAAAGILSTRALPHIRDFANKLSAAVSSAFVAHGAAPTDPEKVELIARYKGLLSEAKTDAVRGVNRLKAGRNVGLIDHTDRDYKIVCDQAARDFELALASLQSARANIGISNAPAVVVPPAVAESDIPKPDRALGVIGVVLAILVPLLQAAGVELDVFVASVAYAILLCVLIWSFLKHVAPNRSKTIKVIGCFVITALYGWLAVYAVTKQSARERGELAAKASPVVESHDSSDQRPWIDVEVSIAGPLAYDEQGDMRLTLNFTLTNVGKTPAANVQICPELVLLFGDPVPAQKRIANEQRAQSPKLGRLGDVLFPGKTITRSWNLPISRADIKKFFDDMDATYRSGNAWKSSGMLMPVLVGCVDYKYTFAEGHHQTAFIYTIAKRDPNNVNVSLSPKISSLPVPEDQLLLVPALGGAANIPPD